MPDPVWFWLDVVSPHMAALVDTLAARGRSVTYVAERPMSQRRADQGWDIPSLDHAVVRFAPNPDEIRELVKNAPANSIHICQGFRGNGLIRNAQKALAARKLKQWIVMETVDDSGWRGTLKRLEYQRQIFFRRKQIAGILATGYRTQQWLENRGMPTKSIFPFAYFLPDRPLPQTPDFKADSPFRFLYVGSFIERKRIDTLLLSLGSQFETNFELDMVGSGPLERELRTLAGEMIPGRANWLGRRHIREIPTLMAGADCLILPSRHDGWGAVVSEALMAGTPAICTDCCGVAGVVQTSGRGGVFPVGDANALTNLLRGVLSIGRQTPDNRVKLATWAQSLGAAAGAGYLDAILRHADSDVERPVAPFLRRVG